MAGTYESTKQRRYRRVSIGGIQPHVRVGRKNGVLLNISEGGLCVSGPAHGVVGEVAPIEFVLPEANLVFAATGIVAWVSSDRTGIQFVNVPPQFCQPLRDWLTEATANFAAPEAEPPEVNAQVFAPTMHGHVEPRLPAENVSLPSGPYLDHDSGLEMVLERLRTATRATGAAIALWDGYGMVCCATSGDAPDCGVRLNETTGLSAECIATGHIVQCDDAPNDPRVNDTTCRQLHFMSAVIAPVIVDGWIFGLLEVFSSQARAFSERHVRLTERLATVAAALVSAPLKPNPDRETLQRELLDVFGRFAKTTGVSGSQAGAANPVGASGAPDLDSTTPPGSDGPSSGAGVEDSEEQTRTSRKYSIKLPMLLLISLLLVLAAFGSGWVYGFHVRSEAQQATMPHTVNTPSSLAQ